MVFACLQIVAYNIPPDDRRMLSYIMVRGGDARMIVDLSTRLRHIQYNGWALQAVQTAVAYGWIEDSMTIKPDTLISQGQLEELLHYVLAQYR